MIIVIMEGDKTTKKHKTYKEYYQEDEEFRNRQKKYLAERIMCECNTWCTRAHIATHRRTNLHKNRLERLSKTTEIEERRKKVVAHIEKLEFELERIDRSLVRIKNKSGAQMEDK
jgi:septal ring factor EnvC (AmiA/AmiB activator)